jgi:hypothetical protein
MTPQEMEAMTADELAAELLRPRTLSGQGQFLTEVRDATAHAARLYPTDAAEAPKSLAHDIASGTDWGHGEGHEWHWELAYELSYILLQAFTPEEA